MATPHPTWYDVLGVEPDATPEQIKTGWRSATDKFEPGSGSGQFRMLNDAADVLLDPVKRAEYDASLGAVTGSGASAVPIEEAGPTHELEPAPAAPVSERKPGRTVKRARTRPARVPASRAAGIVAAVLALLTIAALVTAGYLGLQVRKDARAADARDAAPAAAEAAAKSVFQYDYRHLAADRNRAEKFLTGGYEKEYAKTAALLEKQKDGAPGLAVQTKAVVTSSVLGSAVMDADEDTARVLVYVNLTSKQGSGQPRVFQNRVVMTMKKTGDTWKLSKVKTY